MKTCQMCFEKFDSQFVSQFETLDNEKETLQICQYCEEEYSEYDDKKDMVYIESISKLKFYPSYLL